MNIKLMEIGANSKVQQKAKEGLQLYENILKVYHALVIMVGGRYILQSVINFKKSKPVKNEK